MNLLLKKTALALALAGACGLVSASTTNEVASGAGNQSFSAGVLSDTWTLTHLGITGNFTDTISFTLPGFSDFSYSSNTLYLKGKSDIPEFNVILDGTALTVTSLGKFKYAGDEFTLTGGVHTLIFSGLGALSQGGSYQVQLTAAPIPEPESWALLLSGFGLVGMIARRRSRWMAV